MGIIIHIVFGFIFFLIISFLVFFSIIIYKSKTVQKIENWYQSVLFVLSGENQTTLKFIRFFHILFYLYLLVQLCILFDYITELYDDYIIDPIVDFIN